MKKILMPALIFVLFLTLGLTFAQDVHYADQVTIAWDPVTTKESGEPIEAGTITYEVWTYTNTSGVDQETLIGTTDQTSFTIIFTDHQVYEIGVKAILTKGTEIYESQVSWSVDPAVAPVPFVVQWYPAPAQPENLRIP